MLSASGNLFKCQEEVLYLQPLNTLAWQLMKLYSIYRQLMKLYSISRQLMKLYSILVYIWLFTQAFISVCLDGTVIGSRTILVTVYYCGYVGVWLVAVHGD